MQSKIHCAFKIQDINRIKSLKQYRTSLIDEVGEMKTDISGRLTTLSTKQAAPAWYLYLQLSHFHISKRRFDLRNSFMLINSGCGIPYIFRVPGNVSDPSPADTRHRLNVYKTSIRRRRRRIDVS